MAKTVHVKWVEKLQSAIEISEQKYCSVATTVRGAAEVTYDYTIVEED